MTAALLHAQKTPGVKEVITTQVKITATFMCPACCRVAKRNVHDEAARCTCGAEMELVAVSAVPPAAGPAERRKIIPKKQAAEKPVPAGT